MTKTKSKTLAEVKSVEDPDVEIKHLRSALALKEREIEAAEREGGRLKSLFHDIREAITALPPPAIQYRRPGPDKSRVASPVVHFFHDTDWHEGGVQEASEIEGFNEFSPATLRRRLGQNLEDQFAWVDLHRKAYVVNEARVALTGDLISGGIHDELLWTEAYPVPVQAVKAGELVAERVSIISTHYKQVIVEFVTADNHSRLTRKPQCKEAGLNSWGYVIAFIAKEMLRQHTNVQFNIHARIQTTIDVAGRRYLLCHGDRVRGWAGFPYYGLQRMVGREATKRMRKTLRDARTTDDAPDIQRAVRTLFDRVILGHWHAPMKHPWYWIGGSASGTDAYDHSEGRESEPIQCAWMIHPEHGEFDMTDWRLLD